MGWWSALRRRREARALQRRAIPDGLWDETLAALPFVAASFGGVNNSGALHAYDDPELVFREVWRILRPGGLYVGSTFAEAPYRRAMESIPGRTATAISWLLRSR